MKKRKSPPNNVNSTFTVSREESTVINGGKKEAFELSKKFNFPKNDNKLHAVLIARITDLLKSLPDGPFRIRFKTVASIPFMPDQDFTKRGGVRDQITAEAEYELLPDHLILLLAVVGKIKNPTVSLLSVNGHFLHVKVKERKETIVAKLLKMKTERTVNPCFLPYGLAKHNPPVAVFGTIELLPQTAPKEQADKALISHSVSETMQEAILA